ncbi:hypothetical protein BD289DRAFT_486075 [Coniella lustricola]|uniref:WSC domain-containing protein n=1 Tax=Coniella lustricola TaxID=2025994 RepID=A0A2T2ZWD4_9PEZI|nr:hypothetical protein BD289DRAFT_486075 [Coniella lustricola]
MTTTSAESPGLAAASVPANTTSLGCYSYPQHADWTIFWNQSHFSTNDMTVLYRRNEDVASLMNVDRLGYYGAQFNGCAIPDLHQVQASKCDVPCKGDKETLCGGSSAVHIYVSSSAAAAAAAASISPPGGSQADSESHSGANTAAEADGAAKAKTNPCPAVVGVAADACGSATLSPNAIISELGSVCSSKVGTGVSLTMATTVPAMTETTTSTGTLWTTSVPSTLRMSDIGMLSSKKSMSGGPTEKTTSTVALASTTETTLTTSYRTESARLSRPGSMTSLFASQASPSPSTSSASSSSTRILVPTPICAPSSASTAAINTNATIAIPSSLPKPLTEPATLGLATCGTLLTVAWLASVFYAIHRASKVPKPRTVRVDDDVDDDASVTTWGNSESEAPWAQRMTRCSDVSIGGRSIGSGHSGSTIGGGDRRSLSEKRFGWYGSSVDGKRDQTPGKWRWVGV